MLACTQLSIRVRICMLAYMKSAMMLCGAKSGTQTGRHIIVSVVWSGLCVHQDTHMHIYISHIIFHMDINVGICAFERPYRTAVHSVRFTNVHTRQKATRRDETTHFRYKTQTQRQTERRQNHRTIHTPCAHVFMCNTYNTVLYINDVFMVDVDIIDARARLPCWIERVRVFVCW